MSAGTPDNNPSPKKLLESWEDWKKLLEAIAQPLVVVVTGILAYWNFDSNFVKAIGYILAGLIIIGLIWWFRRTPTAASPSVNEGQLQTNAGFIGLLHYQFSEQFTENSDFDIPGSTRRNEATIGFQILNSKQKRFLIVSGETGCGKSSLLSCGVQGRLHQAGVKTEWIANPRSLRQNTTPLPANLAKRSTFLGNDLQSLRDRVASRRTEMVAGSYLVLMIDQFEELLIDFPHVEERHKIAEVLHDLCTGIPSVKLAIGIRKDYYLDLHDLHEKLPGLLDPACSLPLKNFSAVEAAAIIQECAQRDKAKIEDNFAQKVAKDLAESEFVRPPELQLVCTALRSQLTLDLYSSLGGATGILSNYIKHALLMCPHQPLAQLLLRELCNFGKHAKAEPMSQPQLAAKITESLPALSKKQLTAHLSQSLLQLEKAYLVVKTRLSDGQFGYTLGQDYLADAVNLATQGVSTNAEEAKALVDFYTNERKRAAFPSRFYISPQFALEKWLFIRRNADQALRNGTNYRSLMKESLLHHVAQKLLAAFGVMMLVVLLLTLITYEGNVWELTRKQYHLPPGRPRNLSLLAVPKNEHRKDDIVLTISSDFSAKVGSPQTYSPLPELTLSEMRPFRNAFIRSWRMDDGLLSGCTSGSLFCSSLSKGAFLQTTGNKPDEFWYRTADLKEKKKLKLGRFDKFSSAIDPTGKFIVYQKPDEKFVGNYQVFSIDEDKHLPGFVLPEVKKPDQMSPLLKLKWIGSRYLVLYDSRISTDVDAVSTPDPERNLRIWLWEIGKPEPEKLFDYPASFSFITFNSEYQRFAILTLDHKSALKLSRWSVAQGKKECVLPVDFRRAILIGLSPSGKYVVLAKEATGQGKPPLEFRDFESLDIVKGLYPGTLASPVQHAQWIMSSGGPWLAWPSEATKAKFWDMNDAPIEVDGVDLSLSERHYVLGRRKKSAPDKDHQWLLVINRTQKEQQFHVWNIRDPDRNEAYANYPVATGLYSADLTLDEDAVVVRTEGGVMQVYDIKKKGLVIERLEGVGSDFNLVRYHPDKSLMIWTSDGRVLRYERTWRIGAFSRFFPQKMTIIESKCDDDDPSFKEGDSMAAPATIIVSRPVSDDSKGDRGRL